MPGVLWSNVAIALQKPVFDAKVMLLSANAGPAPLAGEGCNPLFVSSSFVTIARMSSSSISKKSFSLSVNFSVS